MNFRPQVLYQKSTLSKQNKSMFVVLLTPTVDRYQYERRYLSARISEALKEQRAQPVSVSCPLWLDEEEDRGEWTGRHPPRCRRPGYTRQSAARVHRVPVRGLR